METQVLVFGKTGWALAEIEPDIESVTWRLNGAGMARFSLPYTDAKCTPAILGLGNRVLIRFSSGLPDFGGVIDMPRQRTQTGVGITAHSGEALLDWRVSGKDVHFNRMSPGAIFQWALQLENAEYATGIEAGEVYTGGEARTLTYHHYDLLHRAQELARLSGEDFAVTPWFVGGRLRFRGNWYKQRGRDLSSSVLLVEDRNVVSGVLDEQGQIASRVILAGDGVDWGDNRLVGIAESTASRNLYGYREYAETQVGVTQLETLEANAAAILEEKGAPRCRIALEVADCAPAGFADYEVGDRVRVQLFLRGGEWAYDGTVRVMAREWTSQNVCGLEVQTWD